jgi:cholesterol transport system auxiliary component
MLTPLLVHALQDNGSFSVVLHAPSAATSGWRLETELLRLHQDFSVRPSQVRLSLRAVLLDSSTRQAIAWREFDVSVPAASDDPVAGVAAAQAAAQRVVAAVSAFCADQARNARPIVRP